MCHNIYGLYSVYKIYFVSSLLLHANLSINAIVKLIVYTVSLRKIFYLNEKSLDRSLEVQSTVVFEH